VQLPALDLTDALMETRLCVREAAGDLELLIESHADGDLLSPEPRAAMQTADRAIRHLREAQDKLDGLYETIQGARRNQPEEGSGRSARTVNLVEEPPRPEGR
jgi:hypothetical protein